MASLAFQRAESRGSRSVPVVAALLALVVGMLLLVAANASPSGIGMDAPQMLVGATFLAVLVALTLTSLSRQAQVCFQLAYIYFAIYLLLPGYNHISANIFPFFFAQYTPDVRWTGALIVAVFCATLILAQISCLYRHPLAPSDSNRLNRVLPNYTFLGVFWVVLIGCTALFLAAGGFALAFSIRGTDVVDADSATATLVGGLPRAVAAAALAYAIAQARLMPRGRAIVSVLAFLIPALLLNFPLAIPRSVLFGLILFCAFQIIDFKPVNKRAMLSFLFVFGALVAMPVVDALVRGGQTVSEIRVEEIESHYFASGDFDGLQSVNNVVLMRDKYGLQYGRQLLSSALFFVPRAIWPDKAKPTGAVAADAAGFDFTNVSEPMPGEFFIDFGLIGVVVGGVIVALLMNTLDRWIDASWRQVPASRFIAGAFVGYSTPVFRGSLEAVLGPMAVIAVCCILVRRRGFIMQRMPSLR